jgi:hypothetical protein
MLTNDKTPRAFWICAAITAISAVVSASFAVAGLLGPGIHDTFALYAASRSLAIPLVVLILLGLRSREGIAAMALTCNMTPMTASNNWTRLIDASKTYGPLF